MKSIMIPSCARGLLTVALLATGLQTPLAQTTALPKSVLGAIERQPGDSKPLVEGSNDAAIAKMVARLLEQSHFLQQKQKIDDSLSERFLTRYLDRLDGGRMHFLQKDIEEFEPYRRTLDDRILRGDTSPARRIFTRYRERLEQRVSYVYQVLDTEQFDFTVDEVYPLDRRNASRPASIHEAKELWRKHLKYEILQERLNKEAPDAIADKIHRRYAGLLRTIQDHDGDDVLELYLSSLAHVFDFHSDYLGKSKLENFSIGMKLSLFGIGALLQSEDGYCKIVSLVPGGPAAKTKKLKPEDRIIAVAQGEASESVDVVDMKLSKIVEMIRGPKDTTVRLTVIPADATDPSVREEIRIVRDKIELEDQEAKAQLIEVPAEDGSTARLGVIDLDSFYADFNLGSESGSKEPKSTTSDVAKLIVKLKKENMDGLILDLRRNGGGFLEEAISLTGLFIKEGPVVQVKGPVGEALVERDTDPTVLYEGPLVVLTSRFSASASEILAGALQDYGRAVIVGDSSTHGKGTVQSLIQLEPYLRRSLRVAANPGALKITIRKFYRASGASTQLRGVVPDIVLPSLNNLAEVGEAFLENPLPWDTIAETPFEKLNLVQPHLAALRSRSATRIENDQDFIYLEEDLVRVRKSLQEKTVSLVESVRLQEKKDAEERIAARKQEAALRPASPEKVHEITLKNSAEPGLPEPGLATAEDQDSASPDAAVPKEGEADKEEVEETSTPRTDLALKEAKRILLDLIELAGQDRPLAEAGAK